MSDAPDISVEVTPWKYDAQFVYSMTYDEGTLDAIVNSFPIHEEHDIPGHVCTVSGHLGQQRLVRGTSMREVFYMNPEQLRFLINKGWTISSHSHTHVPTNQDGIDLDLEVRLSKWELEKATEQPVRLFAYWGNLRIAHKILPVAKEAGYQGLLSIGYPFNTSDYDEWAIMRGTIGRDLEGWLQEPSVSLYHHTRNAFPGELRQETTRGLWLVDISHIVVDRLPKANGPGLWNRCMTPSILDARLREVRALWGNDLWATVPEEVVEYTLLRRAAAVTVTSNGTDRATCTVNLNGLRDDVTARELTFRAQTPWRNATVNGGAISAQMKDGTLVWTATVEDGTKFVLSAN